jgi:hypothetical protein
MFSSVSTLARQPAGFQGVGILSAFVLHQRCASHRTSNPMGMAYL